MGFRFNEGEELQERKLWKGQLSSAVTDMSQTRVDLDASLANKVKQSHSHVTLLTSISYFWSGNWVPQ